MSVSNQGGFLVDVGGSFNEDAPRPPVPGEEGELVLTESHNAGFPSSKSLKCETSVATPRRSDLDLGYEPEGSASPTPPYLRWAESLHSLLDDQDGIHLFRTFLKQEVCADLLDFWFACSGFRKLEAGEGNDEKRLKLAKAIYKKYILDNNGIVSRQIKPATKSFIKDCVMKLHIDPAMFDQAQTEIQTTMEENTYPLFLKSDIYLEHVQAGGESPKLYSNQSPLSGNAKNLAGYLPTLNEHEEWRSEQEPEAPPNCDLTPSSRLTQRLLTETPSHRTAGRFQEEYRHAPGRETTDRYYANAGHALAPATSANDSEQQSMSSDADTLSLTDSSVDGVPPYRYHKPHRREMHESARANGLVPLPLIPRTYRIPKDIHVAPERFAADLILRLEGVLRERETEERLRRLRLEEEGDDEGFPSCAHPQNYADDCGSFLRDAHEENPESILDEHVQRVMKTPGCQSPGTGRHSPKSRSPDAFRGTAGAAPSWGAQGKHLSRHAVKGESGHHYKHHTHQAESPWGVGSTNMEYATYGSKVGAQCRRTFKRGEEAGAPLENMEKKQKILLWLMEGQKEMIRHKRSPYGCTAGSNKGPGHPSCSWNNVQPSHPFIQDPTMPPNPAPSPLIQLEEVRRRLAEEKMIKSGTVQPKQRYVMEVIQRGRTALRPALFPPLSVVPAVSDCELSEPEHKVTKKQGCDSMTVAYYFCGEPIPYRTSIKGRLVTLSQFKELLTKKGNYRYYFKKVSDEFDCGVVFEEVREDDATLPIFEEKIIGKVEKID
ncbi:axin-1 isoform X1 [Phyllopteryx taeniolatus]|uniref:axin-1 isoform X1 n=1 Tax=Phyllopteryx taeniolatus TaxID=161469 RepID=UPI002AD22FD0|nr:axin-1 isoform X1 [Phyllopteryx taeniolatus]XP_061606352.1 axin-1 isoform X1 [Phyllopteryx taeniolatus]XP_061606353.1 axin-1 isoform X1 [Phyllopteryx taeniolatus]